jgi:hypothetical protein
MRVAFDDLASKGYTYVFSLGGGRTTVLGSLTMGWKSVGSGEPVGWRSGHTALFRWARGAVPKLRFFWRYANAPILSAQCERQPFLHLDRAKASGLIQALRFVSLERTPRPAAMANLIEHLPYDGRIRHVRDKEYFVWRFQNPKHEFRFLYWQGDQLKGYMVLQRYLPGKTNSFRVYIKDWEAITDRTRKDLLEAAIRYGRFSELVTWTVTLPESTKGLLEDAGFGPVDHAYRARGHPTILIRPVRDEDLQKEWIIADRRLLDVANWDLRTLYHE